MSAKRCKSGWLLVEQGPHRARRRVILLPGLLCTDLIYQDMLNDPAFAAADVRVTAANPPGFKGVPPPSDFDFRVETYADMVEQFAHDEQVSLIVGHSFFANVCIELAVRGSYRGKLMLISPSLHRMGEPEDARALDWFSRLPLGFPPWWLTHRLMRASMLPRFALDHQNREQAFVADAKKTPPRVVRRLLTALFDHLDRYGDLAHRLASTKVPVCFVRGERDAVRIEPEQRRTLEQVDRIVVRDLEGSQHFAMLDRPREITALVLDMLGPSVA